MPNPGFIIYGLPGHSILRTALISQIVLEVIGRAWVLGGEREGCFRWGRGGGTLGSVPWSETDGFVWIQIFMEESSYVVYASHTIAHIQS